MHARSESTTAALVIFMQHRLEGGRGGRQGTAVGPLLPERARSECARSTAAAGPITVPYLVRIRADQYSQKVSAHQVNLMKIDTLKLDSIREEVREAVALHPYQAFNGFWICLVKLANLLPTVGEEHEQVASLLRRFTRHEVAAVLTDAGVDRLLDLAPPIEMILADKRERLHTLSAAHEVARVRKLRTRDPKAALAALFEILQRIRNKREHGFKTPSGPRDSEILQAAGSVLGRMSGVVIKNLTEAGSAVSAEDSLCGR